MGSSTRKPEAGEESANLKIRILDSSLRRCTALPSRPSQSKRRTPNQCHNMIKMLRKKRLKLITTHGF